MAIEENTKILSFSLEILSEIYGINKKNTLCVLTHWECMWGKKYCTRICEERRKNEIEIK